MSDLSGANWSIRLHLQHGRCPVKAKKESTKQTPGKHKSVALQKEEKESSLANVSVPEPLRHLCPLTCTNTYLVSIWLFKTKKLGLLWWRSG